MLKLLWDVIQWLWKKLCDKEDSAMPGNKIHLNVGNVSGDLNFAPQQNITNIHNHQAKIKVQEKYIPGTIEADPDLSAYLQHLLNVFNKFYAFDCKIKRRGKTDYSWIRREALEEIGYQMEKTPVEDAERLFDFIRVKIANTIMGKKKLKAGEHLVSTFEEFNAKHGKLPHA